MLYRGLGFTSYWFYGDLQCLLSKYENGCYYFINNYLDIFSVNADVFELYFNCNAMNSPMEPYFDCPFLKTTILSRKRFQWNVDNIKSLLNRKSKILVYLDRRQLPSYGTNARRHQVMICDYDDEKEEFICCDNGPSGKFLTNMRFPYNDVIKAYQSIQDDTNITTSWEEYFVCINTYECEQYELNKEKILASLKSYAGIPPFKIGKDDENYDLYGGIDSFLGLRDRIIGDNRAWLKGLRQGAYAVLCDHKRLLAYACQIFEKEYNLPKGFADTAFSLIKETQILENMIIKYALLPTNLLKNHIVNKLEITREKELSLVLNLIDYLEAVLN